MSPYVQNASCSPWSASCELGNSVAYSINVSSVADAIHGVAFARQHSLRLAIKNTGHE